MKFATKVIHGGLQPDQGSGAVATPIYQTSTFVHDVPGQHRGYTYARSDNPTRAALESNIACLEDGTHALAFASGIAAIDAVLRLFKPRDEIITSNDLYGGSLRLFKEVFTKGGIVFKYADLTVEKQVVEAITDRTRLIWSETPTNPMLNIVDIEMLAALAKRHSILLAVDNTFASPYLQQPLQLGADFSVHSASKYLGGHSDLVLGVVALKSETLYQRLRFIQNTCGAIPGPNDCFLVLRGVKTLQVRMERSCASAMKIAQMLQYHPAVDGVNYPGLREHPGYSVAKTQMLDFGAMMSFTLNNKSRQRAVEVLGKLNIFTLAESLGGVESLCGHPATMSHASVPSDERKAMGIDDSLIRLSVGIEDVDDLMEDLQQALR
jgi:cystathionine beta-lyase/cystathionine gamma-synthase